MRKGRLTRIAMTVGGLVALMSASCSNDPEYGGEGRMGNVIFEWSCVDDGDCRVESGFGDGVLGSVAVGDRIEISARLSSNVPEQIGEPSVELSDPRGLFNGFVGHVPGRVAILAVTSDGVADFAWFDIRDGGGNDSSIRVVHACRDSDDDFNRYGHRCGTEIATTWVAGDRIQVRAQPDNDEYTWRAQDPSLLHVRPSSDEEIITIDMLSDGEAVVVVESEDDVLEQILTIAPGPTRTRPSESEDPGTSGDDIETTGDDTETTGDASSTGMESGESTGGIR